MEYCVICGELIINHLDYRKMVFECYRFITQKYGFFSAIEWLENLQKKFWKLKNKFGELTFCPYCLVEEMKENLERIVGKNDKIMEKWLKVFEGLF